MTLRRLLSIATIIIFFITFAGSWFISMHNFRHFLQNSIQTQTVNTANALAFSLSELGKLDGADAKTMVDAIFETGDYHSVKLISTDQKVMLLRVTHQTTTSVPTWFKNTFPLESKPASALISKGWSQLGTVEVLPEISIAYQQLWDISKQMFGWFIGLLVITLLLEFITLHFILKPIDDITKQALDIINRKFTLIEKLPRLKELRNVGTVMNRMTQKIQTVFEEQSNLIEQLREHAFQDSLTKLGNRRYFNLQADDLLSQNEQKFIGALFILEFRNLDILKLNRGFQIVELYLMEIAEIIRVVTEYSPGTISARVSDSTFAVLVPNLNPAQAVTLAKELTAKLNQLQNSTDKSVVFHLGIAIYKSEQTRTELMSEADKALRAAKQQGANNYVFLEAEQAEKSHAGSFNQFKKLFDDNVAQKSYTLFFQPVMQITMDATNIVSFEALFRLKNPQGVYISAGEFMDLADAHHLTKIIDRLVIERIIELINTKKVSQKLAVNLSINSLIDPEFSTWFKATMKDPAINSRIVFEIDEQKAAQHFDQVKSFIETFAAAGCLFGLDDFGSGLNSIKYIKSMNIYYVKTDSSLIKNIHTNIEEQFYLRTLIEAVRNLDIQVIAKGVENLGQQDTLQQFGINEFQGYFFAKPDVIEKFLDKRS